MNLIFRYLSFKLPLALCLVVLVSASCKSKKNIAKQNVVTTVDTTVEKCRMEFKTGKALSKRMNDSELDFNYASAKFGCELTIDGDDKSFNVSVRCRKD